MEDKISMQLPAKSQYIGAVRLAVSGIAGQLGYDVNEIEDIKSCVAESCIMLLCGEMCETLTIDIRMDSGINVDVKCVDKKSESTGGQAAGGECEEFSAEISKIIIEALSDESEFVGDGGVLRKISFSKKKALA